MRLAVCLPGVWLIVTGMMGAAESKAGLKKTAFGKMPDGQAIDLYTLTNRHGMQAAITNYGGILVSLFAPDRAGHMDDVVLGFDSLDGYLKPEPYFGAIIGRYANRIGHAQFKLDGVEYHLAKNDGDNTLHGGLKGFDKRVWKARDVSKGSPAVELTYLSKDGEESFPGNLSVTVVYTLSDANELRIDYTATTDKDTVLNLANHSYFNLAGQGSGDVLKHQIAINADRFTPVDSGLIPTGELTSVAGTPFDLRKTAIVGAHINDDNEQLKLGKGYDHNFVLNRAGAGLSLAARVTEPGTGRVLEVLTDQPGVQFYTGNFLDGTIRGKGGKVYGHRAALCLETQHFPDSPNKPSFPTTELKPGQTFHAATVYRFR
jgi:aldose 1-epimerase